MRSIRIASAILALSFAALAQAPSADDDRKAIDELHRKDAAATKAYDVDAQVALWSDDFVSVPNGQAPVRGKDANRRALEASKPPAGEVEVVVYRQNWVEVQVAGDYAYEWGTLVSAFRPKGGDVVNQSFNVMRILHRENGAWKIYRTIWNDAPNN
jgi:ketosteroid isomerase-like protein